jgi:16S rRNA (cytosine967-C5)-methyltransferase
MSAGRGGAKKTGSRRTRKPRVAPRVSPARLAAFEILRRVEEEGAYASVLLAAGDEALRTEDRALAYELVLGVLRRQLWLDYLIEHYTGRKASKLDAPVRRALRLGLYQLRFLSRIPASAVVNESVNLAHVARLSSAAALINASLRRAAREPEYDPSALITDEFERIAVRHSHPLWLVKRWAGWMGLEETEKFTEANNLAPPVAFRVVRTKIQEAEALFDELRAAGARLEASGVAQGAWRVEGASGLVRELARRGQIYLQDEASQLVAAVLDAQAGELILDACAAPGSKTTHMADRANDAALIIAGEFHRRRLTPLLEAAARQGLKSVRALVHDAARGLPFAGETFDRALVDAPCTGTGTLRRNPEIRWRIRAEDIQALQAMQLRILRNVARVVRRGGRLVYSTCSVEPEENEQVVARFLDREGEWRQVPVASSDATTQHGKMCARLWPQREGADGFFIAAFERV